MLRALRGQGRRTRAAALCAPPIVFALLATVTYRWAHIEVPDPLPVEARGEILSTLRAGVQGVGIPRPTHAALKRESGGPVLVGLWLHGHELVRVRGTGATIADAVVSAADELARVSIGLRPPRARLKVDLVVGRGPLAQIHPLVQAIGLHPGIDGLGAEMSGGQELYLLPDDLVAGNMLLAGAPLKHVDFKLGVDFRRAERWLAQQVKRPVAEIRRLRSDWFRFRTESFIEDRVDRHPVPLIRGTPPRPELSGASLRAAALAGGRYLVAHLAESGRYMYTVDLATGRGTHPDRPGPYSIPRHAGTTYFLAELYRITGEEFLREPVERAFHHLQELVEKGGCRGITPNGAAYACVIDHGQRRTELGATALAVVALVEYQRATNSRTYESLARDLAEFVLWQQRADGSFVHVFDVSKGEKDENAYLLYYSGEAALALARMHVVTGDPRYRDAAERALDHLVGWYDFFLGGFFYGEEHWTCIAAEAIYPAVEKPEYLEFCRDYGRFLRAQQLSAGEFPDQDDLAGSYMFTPYAMPQNTPTGSRTESMISAYELSVAMGQTDAEILEQIQAAMAYSLGQQVRPEYDWFVAPKAVGAGAIPTTPADRVVRIDYVQHVCSAMIRASELLESR